MSVCGVELIFVRLDAVTVESANRWDLLFYNVVFIYSTMSVCLCAYLLLMDGKIK